jgi:hypothetical protein
MAKKKWIQGAVENKGALRRYVRRKYGKKGFTNRDTIKVSVLHEIIRDPKTRMVTKRRAQFALNVRGLRKK